MIFLVFSPLAAAGEVASGFFDAAFVETSGSAIFVLTVFPKPVAVPELPSSNGCHNR